MLRKLVLAMLFFPPLAFGQGPKVSLDIGSVTVYLGMPRAQVIEKCAAAGYKQLVSDTDKNTITFWTGGEYQNYMVQFRNGRLAYADRQWSLENRDAFESTLLALGSLADRTSAPQMCIIRHVPLRDPDHNTERIFLDCGERSFLLIKDEFRTANTTSYEVVERIGDLRQ